MQNELGSFDDWRRRAHVHDEFSGEITFTHGYGFGSYDLLVFTYLNGKLVRKDYGHLPG